MAPLILPRPPPPRVISPGGSWHCTSPQSGTMSNSCFLSRSRSEAGWWASSQGRGAKAPAQPEGTMEGTMEGTHQVPSACQESPGPNGFSHSASVFPSSQWAVPLEPGLGGWSRRVQGPMCRRPTTHSSMTTVATHRCLFSCSRSATVQRGKRGSVCSEMPQVPKSESPTSVFSSENLLLNRDSPSLLL